MADSSSYQDIEGQPNQPMSNIHPDDGGLDHVQDEPDDSSSSGSEDYEEDEHNLSNDGRLEDYDKKVRDFISQTEELKQRIEGYVNSFESQPPNDDSHDEFFQQFREQMAPPEQKLIQRLSLLQWNILHFIAEIKKFNRRYDWLVHRLANTFPTLLSQHITSGVTVLLNTVKNQDFGFIEAVLDSGIRKEELRDIIDMSDTEGKNCIHYAVSGGFNPRVTIRLLQHTKEETLGKQDKHGLTPLHYAVEYDKCLPEREEMLKALIERSDAAFDRRSAKPDGELSVYEHHLASREKYENDRTARKRNREERKKKKETKGLKDKPSDSPAVRNENRSSREKPDNPAATKHEAKARSHKEEAKSGKMPIEQRNHVSLKNEEGAESKSPRVSGANNMEGSPALKSPNMDTKNQTPIGHTLERAPTGSQKPRTSKKASSEKSLKPSRSLADRILRELKLHYLRTALSQESHCVYKERRTHRNPNTAVRFLYGDNRNEIQIGFEFPPNIPKTPNTIVFKDFQKSYESLKFDQVLQHVEFRQMNVKYSSTKRPNQANSEGTISTGRQDVQHFFRWLFKQKQVENIIHVIVEDGHGIPHSDEAIEESLKNFNIEILDWRKPDLDPMTLRIACKNSDLREVHLWWDGNNAVLRAWSEPDGLVKITTLQIIHLHETKKNIESTQRTKARIEIFKTRIRDHRAKVLQPLECHHYGSYEQEIPGAKGQTPSGMTEKRPKIDTYQWLSVMDRFADGITKLKCLENFPGGDAYLKDGSLPKELQKDVKVALIDDGVNFMHKCLAENMDGGKSFDREYDDGYRPGPREPFHGSATGHGTCMAYMIRRVCPLVKIFGCKLNVLRGNVGKASFTAKSAADAVEYAVSRDFDIISISWTVQLQKDKKSSNSDDINRLEAAIERATKANILVFCSAPDIGMQSGESLETYYPFGCKQSSTNLFKIGAATADGVSLAWMGHKDTVNYILPGHNVSPRETENLPEEDDIPKTGSSVATALASGLAALVIHCVRLAAIYNYNKKTNDSSLNETTVKAIKRFPAMKEAFAILCRNNDEKHTRDRNLRVENFFKTPGDILNNEDIAEEKKWDQVVNIARDLVSYKTLTQSAM